MIAATAAFFIGAVSCSGSSQDLPPEDEAAVYAEVIRQLTTADDTFGGNLNP